MVDERRLDVTAQALRSGDPASCGIGFAASMTAPSALQIAEAAAVRTDPEWTLNSSGVATPIGPARGGGGSCNPSSFSCASQSKDKATAAISQGQDKSGRRLRWNSKCSATRWIVAPRPRSPQRPFIKPDEATATSAAVQTRSMARRQVEPNRDNDNARHNTAHQDLQTLQEALVAAEQQRDEWEFKYGEVQDELQTAKVEMTRALEATAASRQAYESLQTDILQARTSTAAAQAATAATQQAADHNAELFKAQLTRLQEQCEQASMEREDFRSMYRQQQERTVAATVSASTGSSQAGKHSDLLVAGQLIRQLIDSYTTLREKELRVRREWENTPTRCYLECLVELQKRHKYWTRQIRKNDQQMKPTADEMSRTIDELQHLLEQLPELESQY